MTELIATEQDIILAGKSGQRYFGKIYSDKNSSSTITGKAIAVLSSSDETEQGWLHKINSIYNTDDISRELEHFKNRDDISHLLLLPYSDNNNGVEDKVDDLIRNYIHR